MDSGLKKVIKLKDSIFQNFFSNVGDKWILFLRRKVLVVVGGDGLMDDHLEPLTQ